MSTAARSRLEKQLRPGLAALPQNTPEAGIVVRPRTEVRVCSKRAEGTKKIRTGLVQGGIGDYSPATSEAKEIISRFVVHIAERQLSETRGRALHDRREV